MESIFDNGEHLYSAFPHSSKRFDIHYYPDRPAINLKPSKRPGNYTVQLPARRSKTNILTISCTDIGFPFTAGWTGEVLTRFEPGNARQDSGLTNAPPRSLIHKII